MRESSKERRRKLQITQQTNIRGALHKIRQQEKKKKCKLAWIGEAVREFHKEEMNEKV